MKYLALYLVLGLMFWLYMFARVPETRRPFQNLGIVWKMVCLLVVCLLVTTAAWPVFAAARFWKPG